ncbi:MAG: hypothetical protein QOD06_1440 [Candidatus Binatota bacterium]|jgi:signal transduction histidine kinase|nr:hypothetical protein [Candidatus Binatota bacterium]
MKAEDPAVTALILGAGNEALERVLEHKAIKFRVLPEAPEDIVVSLEPELLILPCSVDALDSGSLMEIRRRWPDAEMLLTFAARESATGFAAARVLDADSIVLPLDPQRVDRTLDLAFERRARRARNRRLLDRLAEFDPEVAREVDVIARERETAMRSLEEADRFRSAFIRNISHEIRTPLTIMQGLLDILAEDLGGHLSEDQIDLLDRARMSSAHFLYVVQSLLDLSKAEAGVLEPRPARLFFPDLARDLGKDLAPALHGKPVRFVADMARDVGWITVDPAWFRQILSNLLSNAAKFTSTGEVRLEAKLLTTETFASSNDPATLLRAPAPLGDTLEIVVADTGEGISTAAKERIFEAFQQADLSTTREHQGIGIGLAVVRELAELIGAAIDLESQPGKGTRFRLRLGLHAPETSSAAPAQLPSSRATSALQPERDSRGVLPDFTSLALASPETEEEARALALDLIDRLVRPDVALLAEQRPNGWTIVDLVDRSELGLMPGSALPNAAAVLIDAGGERRAVRETTEDSRPAWSAVSLLSGAGDALGVLAVRTRVQPAAAADDLRILQIVARWLALVVERARFQRKRDDTVSALDREVKSPLGNALAYTQVLLRGLRGPLDDEQRPVVLKLEQTVHRAILSALNLIEYERAIARGFPVEDKPFSLAKVIDHVLSRHSAALELGRHEIVRELPVDLAPCRGDEVRTDRAISNLLRALLERTAEGVPIAVSAAAAGDRVVCGLSTTPQDTTVFLETLGGTVAPLDPTERLGLKVARGWIEAQGGSIEPMIEGDQLTLRISLPAADGGR